MPIRKLFCTKNYRVSLFTEKTNQLLIQLDTSKSSLSSMLLVVVSLKKNFATASIFERSILNFSEDSTFRRDGTTSHGLTFRHWALFLPRQHDCKRNIHNLKFLKNEKAKKLPVILYGKVKKFYLALMRK